MAGAGDLYFRRSVFDTNNSHHGRRGCFFSSVVAVLLVLNDE